MSGYTYATYFGWTWTRNPRTGRWEVFAPGGTHPHASARTWHAAAGWALQQPQTPVPQPLHSAAGHATAKD